MTLSMNRSSFRRFLACVSAIFIAQMIAALSVHPAYASDPPSYKRALPTAEVLLDAGHGGIDDGASYGGVLEKNINLAIAKKVYLLLNSEGIPTVLNRTGDYALSDDNRWHASRSRHRRDLSQRRQLTDEINVQILVSLHVNAGRNKNKRGPLVLHQDNEESVKLATCIQEALNRQQGTHAKPKLGKPFYLLNSVKRPAVIVEMGFITNAEDRAMLTDPQQQTAIAQAIVSGIRQYRERAAKQD
ncbi:N-acetylmuramoyl-L-alanine amidase [Paenibacillus cisolokensis]|uniref:N-acetylmuramoyl-L-alanine amidase family protein n=1 Tax=Paenibacillus cisolokensis TaxID=1658519 RepID=UPI003D29A2C7